ncbi:MAG: hypothetical protein LUQ38_11940, partial [Methanotrichaceae archaeon]|nr:hypothetical protein [Methanotrichaceae archaeon]
MRSIKHANDAISGATRTLNDLSLRDVVGILEVHANIRGAMDNNRMRKVKVIVFKYSEQIAAWLENDISRG